MCYKKSPYSHNKFLKTVDKKFVQHVFLSLKTIPCSLKERTVFKNSFQTSPWNMARAILALSFHQKLRRQQTRHISNRRKAEELCVQSTCFQHGKEQEVYISSYKNLHHELTRYSQILLHKKIHIPISTVPITVNVERVLIKSVKRKCFIIYGVFCSYFSFVGLFILKMKSKLREQHNLKQHTKKDDRTLHNIHLHCTSSHRFRLQSIGWPFWMMLFSFKYSTNSSMRYGQAPSAS